MNILYIILKHVVWRFQIYEHVIYHFKARGLEISNIITFAKYSNYEQKQISKSVHKIATFEYFAKIIIFEISIPGALK